MKSAAPDPESLADWCGTQPGAPDLNEVILALAEAGMAIARDLSSGGADASPIGGRNATGDTQKPLDLLGQQRVVEALAGNHLIAALVSEEAEDLIVPDETRPGAPYVVCFDPLDGSSNLDVNGPAGTIFSVLGRQDVDGPVTVEQVLDSASNQLAAGYVLYGPRTQLVVTFGSSVALFSLDPGGRNFVLADAGLKVPAGSDRYFINAAHAGDWEQPVADYVADLVAGEAGPRGKRFNMRWTAAMVLDIHRLFFGGGIFLYPALTRPGGETGKLRFLYEANPMALIVEAAGGAAIAGDEPLREIRPESLHQTVPVAIGSRDEIGRLLTHYR